MCAFDAKTALSNLFNSHHVSTYTLPPSLFNAGKISVRSVFHLPFNINALVGYTTAYRISLNRKEKPRKIAKRTNIPHFVKPNGFLLPFMDTLHNEIETCRASVTVHQRTVLQMLLFIDVCATNETQFHTIFGSILEKPTQPSQQICKVCRGLSPTKWTCCSMRRRQSCLEFYLNFKLFSQNIKCMKWLYTNKNGTLATPVMCIPSLFDCIEFTFSFGRIFSRGNSNNHNILWAKYSEGPILFVLDKIFTC